MLVTGSQGPINSVPGVRVPCPRVLSLKAQGSSSRVPGSQGPGSQSLRSQGPGSQVSVSGLSLRIQDAGPLRWGPRSKTRDSYFTWDPRTEAQDTERETWENYIGKTKIQN